MSFWTGILSLLKKCICKIQLLAPSKIKKKKCFIQSINNNNNNMHGALEVFIYKKKQLYFYNGVYNICVPHWTDSYNRLCRPIIVVNISMSVNYTFKDYTV